MKIILIKKQRSLGKATATMIITWEVLTFKGQRLAVIDHWPVLICSAALINASTWYLSWTISANEKYFWQILLKIERFSTDMGNGYRSLKVSGKVTFLW